MQVDGSNVGVGAVLLQAEDQGGVHPFSFFAKKFCSYHLNYSVVEKYSFGYFNILLYIYINSSVPLIVFMDHNPLVCLNSLKCPNQRLVHWALFLQSFCLDIRHLKGSEMLFPVLRIEDVIFLLVSFAYLFLVEKVIMVVCAVNFVGLHTCSFDIFLGFHGRTPVSRGRV